MQVRATARFVRISPKRMNIVAGLIRRKPFPVAAAELSLRGGRCARVLSEVLESAAANAYCNHSLDRAALIVSNVLIGQGPRLRRSRPRAFGRASPLLKPTAHITVVVEGEKTIAKVALPRKAHIPPPAVSGKEQESDVAKSRQSHQHAPMETAGRVPPSGSRPKGFLRRIFQRKSG